MDLNDAAYGTVRSNIIQKEPVPKVKQVLAQIFEEEQHKNFSKAAAMEEKEGVGIAFVVIKPTVSPLQGTHTAYNHSHKSGHDIENGFQLVVYPYWWPENSGTPSAPTGRSGRANTGNWGRE